jgi:hypothetical protein
VSRGATSSLAASVTGKSSSVDPTFNTRLAAASADVRQYECNTVGKLADGAPYCVSGRLDSPTTVVMLGDSHARQWKQAMAAAANDVGVRLVDRYRGACPAIDVRLQPAENNDDSADCAQFRADSLQLIDEVHPSAVILSQAGYLGRVRDANGDAVLPARAAQLWSDAYTAFLKNLLDKHITPITFIDNPADTIDPTDCLSKNQAVDPCKFTRAVGLGPGYAQAQAEAAVRTQLGGGILTFGTSDQICERWVPTCELEVNGTFIFADGSHLTSAFTMTQLPRLDQLLRDAHLGS